MSYSMFNSMFNQKSTRKITLQVDSPAKLLSHLLKLTQPFPSLGWPTDEEHE